MTEPEFSPLEFLAELQQHIPNRWEQTSRFFGIYSSKARGKKRREEELRARMENPIEPLEHEPEELTTSSTWAKCMAQVFELDPLLCPKCGEHMRIIAFIHDPYEIEKIADNLGCPTWRAPPSFEKTGTRYDFSPEFVQ